LLCETDRREWGDIGVQVSTDDGRTFNEAALPLTQQSTAEYFEVVDATEGEVLIAAQHTAARMQGDVRPRLLDLAHSPYPVFI
jgi:hypothetical protein